MSYRTGNYVAFYVSEPFSESSLNAHATKDFLWYNLLKAWKSKDSSFPFINSHDKNYNVRDDSDWEKTLKPRLHDRLNKSKNIILFLSSYTKNSKALREEIDYGINKKGLPIIIVYPEYTNKSDIYNKATKKIKPEIKSLWNNIPVLSKSIDEVPTLHIPFNQKTIKEALNNKGFMIQTKKQPGRYYYPE